MAGGFLFFDLTASEGETQLTLELASVVALAGDNAEGRGAVDVRHGSSHVRVVQHICCIEADLRALGLRNTERL